MTGQLAKYLKNLRVEEKKACIMKIILFCLKGSAEVIQSMTTLSCYADWQNCVFTDKFYILLENKLFSNP